uniref:Uncharacterized protein n=1 Tax=Rhizophora mucronata TaxID=61149 RepID=A0A2P2M9C8_RHIMU
MLLLIRDEKATGSIKGELSAMSLVLKHMPSLKCPKMDITNTNIVQDESFAKSNSSLLEIPLANSDCN